MGLLAGCKEDDELTVFAAVESIYDDCVQRML